MHFVFSTLHLHPEWTPNSISSAMTASKHSNDASKNMSVSSAKRLKRIFTPLISMPLISGLFSNLFVKTWATRRNKMGESGLPWCRPLTYVNRGAEVSINVGIAHTPVEGHLHQVNEILSKPHTFQSFEKKVMLYRVECFFKVDLKKKTFLFRFSSKYSRVRYTRSKLSFVLFPAWKPDWTLLII